MKKKNIKIPKCFGDFNQALEDTDKRNCFDCKYLEKCLKATTITTRKWRRIKLLKRVWSVS